VCRHLAYIGPPIALSSLLYDPPHSLVRQSWAPRHQRHGTVNADGYGVGWYAPQSRPEPARYRRSGAIWTDRSLASMAGVVASGAVMAAVRSATPPAPSEESGAAPFTSGPWLWSINGAVATDLTRLRRSVSDRRARAIEGTSDGEVLFALLLDLLDRGCDPADALVELLAIPGRLNLLLTDGSTIWATAWGDTLWIRTGRDSAVVASEPYDDDDWTPVPERTLVVAGADHRLLTPLPVSSGPANPKGLCR
jgi:gamma-glutamyl hercynylcysteine S-oxide hydrolase